MDRNYPVVERNNSLYEKRDAGLNGNEVNHSDAEKVSVSSPVMEGVGVTEGNARKVLYGVEDVPSALSCFLFGLQQAVMTIGGTLSIPFIISSLICTDNNPEVTSILLSVTMFMCGIATILQSLFGVRLGMIQGGSHTFVAPIVAMMSIDKWRCGENDGDWQRRMREIQGSLMLASITQLVLGSTGMIGVLMQFIGPLTIAPTISLIGLSLTGVVIEFNEIHWGIAALSAALCILFGLYLGNVALPIPGWTRREGCHVMKYPVFQLLPVIFSLGVSWIVCYALTITDTLTTNSSLPEYQARTDARLEVVERAPWFYWPYPFQFGMPTVSASGYVGFLAATISSIIESIGDYYAAAGISGAPAPPTHAVNRGIAMEGLASIISGMVGAGHGTTSYSSNIGAIGITKVASRSVFVTAGVILVVCGVIGKFGAVASLIPGPIIGGQLTVVLGMVIAVGISALRHTDMQSTRNLTIIGVSMLLGLAVPQYVSNPKNQDKIKTGYDELDQVLKVLLGSAMLVGGFVGCFLDNTVPGTKEERGIVNWTKATQSSESKNKSLKMYEFPYVTKYIRKVTCCSYVPISPTFDRGIELKCNCCCRSKGKGNELTPYMYDNPLSVQPDDQTKSNGESSTNL